MKKTVCLLAALAVSVLSMACSKVEARMKIRDANVAYQQEQYQAALQNYLDARKTDPSFAELDRMIGYSYIGLYNPEDDSPENQKYADQAITELQRYLRKRPGDSAAREAMVNLMLNADRTAQAIDYFKKYLEEKPADLPTVRSIATLYAKQGNFDESLNWYEKITLLDARNPEAHYTFGVVVYEKVAKNPPAEIEARIQYIERGKKALEKAMGLREDYFEAIVYLNLLYREQAKLELDPVLQQELLAKADEYRNQAIAIARARKAAEEKAAKGE